MKINVAIPTHWRSDIIKEKTLFLLRWLWYDITIFANPKWEEDKYKEELWNAYKIVEIGKFTTMWALRNEILSYYKEWDMVLMIDDDIWNLYNVSNHKLFQMTPTEIQNLIEQWFWMCEASWYKLRWLYPSNNPMCMSNIIKYDKFIIGCFMWIIKSNLQFDNNINCKEDYDFTIQNVLKHGWVIRFEWYCTDNKYWITEWWLQATWRTDQWDIKKIKQKRWKIIRDNPKRPNEILLNFKR